MDKPVVRTPRRRREHSAEFKRQLVVRSLEPGASVAAVAMEGGINANLLFGWRRKYLEDVPHTDRATPLPPQVVLLPVSIQAVPTDKPSTPSSPPMRAAAGAIEIEIGNARVRLRGHVDEASLRTVLTALRGLA